LLNLVTLPGAVAYLGSKLGQSEFSAVTFSFDKEPWIVHNDYHHRHRQAANIAHELAHGLLMHEPAPLKGLDGRRTFNRSQEEEAHWLGPALLISEEAALHIVKSQQPFLIIRETYGVSDELLQMRLRVTGLRLRVGRRRAA
jgi:Zn-dependent peptidase ImmA (M78 family)